jgi:predicted GNAT superfamily acetyltransferase
MLCDAGSHGQRPRPAIVAGLDREQGMDTNIDRAAVLALNLASETETSPLDAAALEALIQAAFHVGLRDAGRTAVLISFDQDAAYGSPNFLWFRERHPRFVYVDRIIVSGAARGQGHARSLYEELFAAARAAGHDLVCCEVNIEPPNPASDAFHAALGFVEVGEARLAANGKRVRYLVRRLTGDVAR